VQQKIASPQSAAATEHRASGRVMTIGKCPFPGRAKFFCIFECFHKVIWGMGVSFFLKTSYVDMLLLPTIHLFNPLNAVLNPICHLLALLGTHHIFHVCGMRVKFYKPLFIPSLSFSFDCCYIKYTIQLTSTIYICYINYSLVPFH